VFTFMLFIFKNFLKVIFSATPSVCSYYWPFQINCSIMHCNSRLLTVQGESGRVRIVPVKIAPTVEVVSKTLG